MHTSVFQKFCSHLFIHGFFHALQIAVVFPESKVTIMVAAIVEHTNGDADEFVKQYGAVVDELKKSVPGAHIFVNAIFPVQEKAVKEKPVFAEIENFNEKLKELCDKKRIAFIDSSDLVSDEYYEQDGIHFKASFYPVWAEKMAEVAGL